MLCTYGLAKGKKDRYHMLRPRRILCKESNKRLIGFIHIDQTFFNMLKFLLRLSKFFTYIFGGELCFG